ncbi:MAG: class F sortase [Chloroflexota bacterium]|nr:class F sortase [Chloroflexota bacterium]
MLVRPGVRSRVPLILFIVSFAAAAVLLALGIGGLVVNPSSGRVELPYRGDVEAVLNRTSSAPVAPLPATPPSSAPISRMVIEAIGVDAAVVVRGLDAQAVPEEPGAPDVVAWYDFSSRPGAGSNAVFAGHVDWTYDGRPGPAVFWSLKDLKPGDIVRVLMEDGTQYDYAVTANFAVPYDDPKAVEVMGPTPNDVITLITCGGIWTPDLSLPLGGNYSHRIIVRAERVVA